MFKLAGLSLAAVGFSGLAAVAEVIGLPEGSNLGALGMAGFLVVWVCREYVAMRKEHREERKELTDSLKALGEQNRDLLQQNTEAYEGLILTLKQRPCLQTAGDIDG